MRQLIVAPVNPQMAFVSDSPENGSGHLFVLVSAKESVCDFQTGTPKDIKILFADFPYFDFNSPGDFRLTGKKLMYVSQGFSDLGHKRRKTYRHIISTSHRVESSQS